MRKPETENDELYEDDFDFGTDETGTLPCAAADATWREAEAGDLALGDGGGSRAGAGGSGEGGEAALRSE
jgi:hypothetical protein